MAGARRGSPDVRQVTSRRYVLVPAGKYGGREKGQCRRAAGYIAALRARARREVWRARGGAVQTRGRLASCAAVSTRFSVINRFYHGETIHAMRNMLHLRQASIKQKEVFK